MAEAEQFVEEVEEEEEDEEDPQDVLKEKCAQLSTCSKLQEKLDECNERVSSSENPSHSCVEELFDFVHCVEHCVAKNLFQKLK